MTKLALVAVLVAACRGQAQDAPPPPPTAVLIDASRAVSPDATPVPDAAPPVDAGAPRDAAPRKRRVDAATCPMSRFECFANEAPGESGDSPACCLDYPRGRRRIRVRPSEF